MSDVEVEHSTPTPDPETREQMARMARVCEALRGARLALDSALQADALAALEQLAGVATRSRAKALERRGGGR